MTYYELNNALTSKPNSLFAYGDSMLLLGTSEGIRYIDVSGILLEDDRPVPKRQSGYVLKGALPNNMTVKAIFVISDTYTEVITAFGNIASQSRYLVVAALSVILAASTLIL